MSLADLQQSHVPAPGAAPAGRMVLAQATFELRLLLRNGEQLLLTLIIPAALLIGLTLTHWVDLGADAAAPGARIQIVAPGILALAVMSTAFTAQAIATGFDRRYGVLKYLGATPLSRTGLLAAKTLAVLAIEFLQIAILAAIALGLGWAPRGNPAVTAVLLLLGTAAFSVLGLALAGLLRAEATLAVANAIYLVLLLAGGTVIPLYKYPAAMAAVIEWLPSGALAQGLRVDLLTGALPWLDALVLALWTGVGAIVAARTFKWE